MEEVDSRTFLQWKVFNAIDPEAVERSDWHNAALLTMLRNINKATDSAASTPSDFVYDRWSEATRRRVLDNETDKPAKLKETLSFFAAIPGVTVTVLKPEVLEDEHH